MANLETNHTFLVRGMRAFSASRPGWAAHRFRHPREATSILRLPTPRRDRKAPPHRAYVGNGMVARRLDWMQPRRTWFVAAHPDAESDIEDFSLRLDNP